jgi:hypothetical protein
MKKEVEDVEEKKDEHIKMEETATEEKVEEMDTSQPPEIKEEMKDGKFICNFVSTFFPIPDVYQILVIAKDCINTNWMITNIQTLL